MDTEKLERRTTVSEISDKLQAVVDTAEDAYSAGPNTINRKLTEVDTVLEAAVDAIKELDERTS